MQEAENQIITPYEVYDQRPTDSSLLVNAVEIHEQQMGSLPRIVAADAGFYAQANEKRLQQMGVKNVSVPNRHSRSEQRRWHEKTELSKKVSAGVRDAQGRTSVLQRRHGLNRCLYRGQDGMQRWVGLGVIADNLINMGLWLAS